MTPVQYLNPTAQGGGVGQIEIFGTLTRERFAWYEEVSPTQVRDELKRQLGDISQLRVRIDSDGGSILAGFAIYDALQLFAKENQVELITEVVGVAASMASVLMLAGSTRRITPNAWVMIHEAEMGVQGTVRQVRSELEFLEKLETRGVEIYAEQTSLDEERLRDLMAKTHYFTAAEAVEAGFADEVMELGGRAASSATFEMLARYPNVPPELRNHGQCSPAPEPLNTEKVEQDMENEFRTLLGELNAQVPDGASAAEMLAAGQAALATRPSPSEGENQEVAPTDSTDQDARMQAIEDQLRQLQKGQEDGPKLLLIQGARAEGKQMLLSPEAMMKLNESELKTYLNGLTPGEVPMESRMQGGGGAPAPAKPTPPDPAILKAQGISLEDWEKYAPKS